MGDTVRAGGGEKTEAFRDKLEEHMARLGPEEADCYRRVVRERARRMLDLKAARVADEREKT